MVDTIVYNLLFAISLLLGEVHRYHWVLVRYVFYIYIPVYLSFSGPIQDSWKSQSMLFVLGFKVFFCSFWVQHWTVVARHQQASRFQGNCNLSSPVKMDAIAAEFGDAECLYDVLEVKKTATQAEIKKAYFKIALKCVSAGSYCTYR